MEDIHFLKQNATKESYMFVIDSDDRDKNIYPNPNNYSIRFNTPFKNVYSLEVLDASIPRTQYLINPENDSLVFNVNYGPFQTIHLEHGDYSQLTMIEELNNKLSSHITVENLSSPAEKRNQYIFRSSYPFSFDMKQSSIRTILGFNEYNTGVSRSNQLFSSVVNYDHVENVTFIPINSNVDGHIYDLTIETGNILYQTFVPNFHCNLDYITININDFDLQNEVYINDTIMNIEKFDSYIVCSSNFTFDANVEYVLKVVLNVNSNIRVYTQNDEQFMLGINSSSFSLLSFNEIYNTLLGLNELPTFFLSLDFEIHALKPNYTLVPPGVYTFVGDRYILLKCKEIEDHLYHSRSFEKYTLGLAKFKLSVIGYGDERFDYTSLPTREFHPIGKLEYLSFRFERNNGSLYDFKGINHSLTMIIRYYVNISDFSFESKLNPSYNPNFNDWWVQNEYTKRNLKESDSDESNDYSD